MSHSAASTGGREALRRRARHTDAPGAGSGTRPAGAPHAGTDGTRDGAHLHLLPLYAVLLVSIGLGCVGLAGALNGLWWVPSVAATVIVVLLVTGTARFLRLPSAAVTVLGLAALLLAVTIMHLSGSSLLGFIPTGSTFTRAGELWSASGRFVSRQPAPYGPDPGLAFVLCALVGLVTVFMETVLLGLRMAALACVGLLALLVMPALTMPASVPPLGAAAAVIAALALLAGSRRWGATRETRVAPAPGGPARALIVVAGVLAATLLVPAVMPGFYTGVLPQGTSLSGQRAAGVGPLRAVGQDLRSTERTERFSYTISDGSAQYMRLMTLTDFTQDEWFPDTSDLHDGLDGMDERARQDVPHGSEITSKITFADFDEHWLPAPYAPSAFSGLGESGWSWNPRDLSVHSESSGMSGKSFTVTSRMPDVGQQSLRAAASAAESRGLSDALEVPATTPGEVTTAAHEMTEGARSDYEKALALQEGLRGFHYDVNAPVADGYDAGGMDALARFMQTRTGYAGHFAPAMAVMARELGIPARVAVGYLPTQEHDGRFTVSTGDAHAWPELYFEGVGWVRFEPTPGVPTTPDYAPDQANDPGRDSTPPPSASPSQTPSRTSSTPPGSSESPSDGPSQEPSPEPTDRTDTQSPGLAVPAWVLITVPLLVILALLAALPRVIRGRRRSARLATMADDRRPATERARAAWAELEDLAVDHGAQLRASDTPRVRARRLAAQVPAAQDAVDRLAGDLERASYGDPSAPWNPRATAEDLGRVDAVFREREGRGQAWRATWWPASLFDRT